MSTVNCCAADGGIFGVDGLVDAGNDHGGVAGVFAGSVDGVPVPGSVGQSCGGKQRGFDLAQSLVQLGQVAGWGGLRAWALAAAAAKRAAAASAGAKSSEPSPSSSALRLAASR